MPRLGTFKVHFLHKEKLANLNIKIGRDKFNNLIHEERLLVKRKKKFTKTTNSMHRYKKHKNLIKDLNITQPEQVWVSDITYIKLNKDTSIYRI